MLYGYNNARARKNFQSVRDIMAEREVEQTVAKIEV